LEPGRRLRVRGVVGEAEGHLAMSDPTYVLLPEADDKGRHRGDKGRHDGDS
jgi:hypothetical protein